MTIQYDAVLSLAIVRNEQQMLTGNNQYIQIRRGNSTQKQCTWKLWWGRHCCTHCSSRWSGVLLITGRDCRSLLSNQEQQMYRGTYRIVNYASWLVSYRDQSVSFHPYSSYMISMDCVYYPSWKTVVYIRSLCFSVLLVGFHCTLTFKCRLNWCQWLPRIFVTI